MKKTQLLLYITLLLSILLTGCNTGAKTEDDPNKINVVATIFPQYDYVRQIAGENVDLKLLLPPGAESHSYEPTPRDIIDIQNSDIFIYVGGESDAWIEDILSSMDTSNMQMIALMDCVDAVEEELVEGMQAHEHEEDGHAHDDEHVHDAEEVHEEEDSEVHHAEEAEYDEHVWTSPKNAILITEKITEALQSADVANAAVYADNSTAYIEQLKTLDAQFEAVVDQAARKVMVFGDRFPMRYFADAYGLTYYAAFPGCAAESEPSAATISFLINEVKAEQIPVVFHIEFSNEKVADAICESTEAKKLLFHSCHNVSSEDLSAGVTYVSLMQENMKNLKEALQ